MIDNNDNNNRKWLCNKLRLTFLILILFEYLKRNWKIIFYFFYHFKFNLKFTLFLHYYQEAQVYLFITSTTVFSFNFKKITFLKFLFILK